MNAIVITAGFLLLLWLGRPILIPMLVAVFLWYLINAIASYYRRAMPLRERQDTGWRGAFFDWVAVGLALVTLGGAIYLFATQVRPMFFELLGALPRVQARLIAFIRNFGAQVGVGLDASMIPNITKIATNIGASLASLATSMGMILVYILFLFVEQRTFNKKFAAMV